MSKTIPINLSDSASSVKLAHSMEELAARQIGQ